MVTSGLGSDLVYVEKTPVSSFSSKGDMLSRRAVSQAGFLPLSKEERRHRGRKKHFPKHSIVDSDFLECLQTVVHFEHVEGYFVLLEWNREVDVRESIYELQAVQVTR